jgi:hypothetical protein
VQDSVAHSQMKGTFSTSSYLAAAVAIFSFASLNFETLWPSRSSLDCMPQLIHLRPQEKTFVPKGTARTSPPHERPPERFGFALLSGISSLSLSYIWTLAYSAMIGIRPLSCSFWTTLRRSGTTRYRTSRSSSSASCLPSPGADDPGVVHGAADIVAVRITTSVDATIDKLLGVWFRANVRIGRGAE